MKPKKQTSFFIDPKTDRLFNITGASHDLKNRGETAKAALMFLDAVQSQDKFPEEVKTYLNNLFETIVYDIQNSDSDFCDGDNRPKLIG